MSNAGRKPKPTELKVLQGTVRPDRLPANPLQPSRLGNVPTAPPMLSETGANEWHTVCSELQALGMLYTVDLSLVAAYCNEMAIYWEMEELLRKNGRVVALKNDDGSLKYMQQVPQVAIGRNALIMAAKLAVQFGLTPAARSKLSGPGESMKDEFDQFLTE